MSHHGFSAVDGERVASRLLRFARNDSKKRCHCEERSDAAISLVTEVNAKLPLRWRWTTAVVLLLVVLALAGCGKKGSPQPPPGEPNTYPRTYPSG